MDPQRHTHTCYKCRKPNSSDWLFCAYCGVQTQLELTHNSDTKGLYDNDANRFKETQDADAVSAGAVKAGAVKEGAVKAGAVKEGAVKAGAVKEGAVKEGAVKEGAVKAGAVKAGAVKAGHEIEDQHDRDTDSVEETPYAVPSIHVIDSLVAANKINSLDGTSNDVVNMMTELEIKGVLIEEDKGYSIPAILKKLRRKYEAWRDIHINIAIVGESGCGKSTLINALRGLKSDDVGAAKVGCNETTTDRKLFPHPNNPNLVLWDLPGVGTKSFPQETYLTKVNFDQYDFIILLSCTRFTTLDEWLAKQINRRFPEATLYFVRSKVDSDLQNINMSRRNPMTKREQDAQVNEMRDATCRALIAAGITNYSTFMINSNNPNEFDFGKLVDLFIKKVSAVKQETIVLSQTVLTNKVVEAKIGVIIKQMKGVATHAAVAAATSNREKGEYLEIEILRNAFIGYQNQLGIDRRALERIADYFKCDISTELESESELFLTTFRDFCKRHDKVEFSLWHLLPFLGKIWKTQAYYKQCIFVLQKSFNACIRDNFKLRTIIHGRMPR